MKKRHKYTEEELEDIKQKFESGATPKEIAEIYSVDTSNMRQRLARMGLLHLNSVAARTEEAEQNFMNHIREEHKSIYHVSYEGKSYTDITELYT